MNASTETKLTMDGKIAKLDEVYKAVDRALALYSEKANSNDALVRANAGKHYEEYETLRIEARKITASLTNP